MADSGERTEHRIRRSTEYCGRKTGWEGEGLAEADETKENSLLAV